MSPRALVPEQHLYDALPVDTEGFVSCFSPRPSLQADGITVRLNVRRSVLGQRPEIRGLGALVEELSQGRGRTRGHVPSKQAAYKHP